jgi:hypothetical protein
MTRAGVVLRKEWKRIRRPKHLYALENRVANLSSVSQRGRKARLIRADTASDQQQQGREA